MQKFTFLSGYRDNKPYRMAFSKLGKNIFSIDFERFYDTGYWDDSYVCFTYFDGEKAVANVSVNRLKLILDGNVYKAIQIGTVMTHLQYRGQGLAADLINRAMHEYEADADLFYLFANRTVLDFYPRFGFSRVKECIYTADITTGSITGSSARQLDISSPEDLELLDSLASERVPVSARLGVASVKHLTMIHSLFAYYKDLYYLKDTDAVVICKEVGDTLHIYDVICKKRLDFQDFIGEVASDGTRRVQFHFTPDYKDFECKSESYEPEDDIFFVKSSKVAIPDGLFYPATAHA
jgi:GNAT superfamily N-acetyltransferase